MQLKRLEAYGFKSFADKVDIEFDKGITAVVGPNGSGKSNITDAIKWALGEQNVRNIRGTKSEDVIFNGSAARKPMGVAEVSLFFENDGTLPVDFHDVAITRRLFRSGESEFLINKSRCRLKDIHNLFADTGIGSDGMGVISQNKIDEILNARPEERRLFFEEAAGITKFRNRKKETLRKLESTEANLTRVSDILGEIENQLEPLRLSAEKTKRYNELQGEYKKNKLAVLYHNYQNLDKSSAAQQTAIQAKRDEETAARTAQQLAESHKAKTDAKIIELEGSLAELATARNGIHEKIELAQREIKVLEERQRQGRDNVGRLEQQQKQLARDIESAREGIEEYNAQGAESKQQASSIGEEIEEYRQQAQESGEGLRQRKKALDAMDAELQQKGELLTRLSMDLNMLQKDLDNDMARQLESQARVNELQEAISGFNDQKRVLEAQLQQYNIAIAENDRKRNADQAELDNAISAGKQLAVREQTVLKEFHGSESRLQIMQRMQQSYEGFGRGVKAVLKSSFGWRSGVCGAVAELIDVPQKYVTAIEIALGAGQQNVVVEDADVAKQAISFLKRDRLGRVTFLPLSTIFVRQNKDQINGNNPGIIGWADSLVTTDSRYTKVSQFLLGRTLIVDNIDNALAIARSNGQRLRIVTLGGELISPGGAMTGGTAQRDNGFLNRSSEIKELTARVRDTNEQLRQLKEAKRANEAQHKQLASQLEILSSKQHELELNRQEVDFNYRAVVSDLESYNNELLDIEEAVAGSVKAINELKKQLESIRIDHSVTKAEQMLLEKEAELARREYAELDQEADDLAAAINSLELEKTVYDQKVLRFREQAMLRSKDIERCQASVTANAGEISRQQAVIAESQQGIIEYRAECESRQVEFDSINQQHTRIYDERMQQLVEAQRYEKESREAGHRISRISEEIHKIELTASKIDYDMEQCRATLLSEYGVLPERAAELVTEISDAELKRNMHRLDNEIQKLGIINPNALTEYDELLQRHEFLQRNADDLVAAKDNLLTIIGEMDNTMTKQFTAAFARIGVYFDEIFKKLFGGGEAQIKLTDPENVLESGVDIIVQVPDKKRQPLAMLSGGERALTVVSLLFSFLKHRPAPFSVLDELDAPLDEANISRFSTFLRDYSDSTQFIIVTHRKGTMENADAMYGVTVENAGVSKVLSVKLDRGA